MLKKLGRTLRGSGKAGLKYKLEVQILQLENVPKSAKTCRLVWSRSAKVQLTDTKEVDRKGVATFKQTLTQIATIYPNPKGGYDAKEYSFKVQVPSSSGDLITIGKADINMSNYISGESSVQNARIPITFKIGQQSVGNLVMTVTCTLLKEDSSTGDHTNVSDLSGVTSQTKSVDDQNLEGFESSPDKLKKHTVKFDEKRTGVRKYLKSTPEAVEDISPVNSDLETDPVVPTTSSTKRVPEPKRNMDEDKAFLFSGSKKGASEASTSKSTGSTSDGNSNAKGKGKALPAESKVGKQSEVRKKPAEEEISEELDPSTDAILAQALRLGDAVSKLTSSSRNNKDNSTKSAGKEVGKSSRKQTAAEESSEEEGEAGRVKTVATGKVAGKMTRKGVTAAQTSEQDDDYESPKPPVKSGAKSARRDAGADLSATEEEGYAKPVGAAVKSARTKAAAAVVSDDEGEEAEPKVPTASWLKAKKAAQLQNSKAAFDSSSSTSVSQLRAQNEELAAELQELKDQLTAAEAERAVAIERVAALEIELQNVPNVEELREMELQYQQQLADQEAQLKAMQQQLASAHKDADESVLLVTQQNGEMRELREELEQLRQQKGVGLEKSDKVPPDPDDMESELQLLREQVEELERENANYKETVTRLRKLQLSGQKGAVFKDMEKEMEQLKTQVEELELENVNCKQANTDLELQLEQLVEELERAVESGGMSLAKNKNKGIMERAPLAVGALCDALESRVIAAAEMQEKIATLTTQLDSSLKEMRTLEQELSQRDGTIASQQEELAQLQAELERLADEEAARMRVAANKDSSSAAPQKSGNEQSSQDLHALLLQYQDYFNDLEHQLAAAQEEIASLREERGIAGISTPPRMMDSAAAASVSNPASERSTVTADLEAALAENTALTARVKSLNTALDEARLALAARDAELAETRTALAGAERARRDAEVSLKEYHEEVLDAQRLAEEWKAEAARLREALELAEADAAELHELLDAAEAEKEEIRNSILNGPGIGGMGGARAGYEYSYLDPDSLAVAALEQQLAASRGEKEELSATKRGLTGEVAQLKRDVAGFEGLRVEKEELEMQISKLLSRIEVMRADLAGAEHDRDQLQAQVDGLVRHYCVATGREGEATAEEILAEPPIVRQQSSMDPEEDDGSVSISAKLRKERNQLKRDLSTAQSTIGELSEAKEQLESSVGDLQGQVARLTKELGAARQLNDNLLEQLAQMEERAQDGGQRDDSDVSYIDSDDEGHPARARNKQVKGQASSLDRRIAELEQELAATTEELEQERAERQELEERLRQQVEDGDDEDAASLEALHEAKYNRLMNKYKMLETRREREVDALESQLDEAMKEVEQLRKQVKELQNARDRAGGSGSNDIRGNNDSRSRSADVNKELEELQQENEALVTQLVARNMELADLAEREIIAKRDLIKIKETNMKLANKMTKLETSLYSKSKGKK